MLPLYRSQRLACVAACVPWLLILCAGVAAQDENAAPQPISYYRQVRPLFQKHCFGCHQPAKSGGEYIMSAFEAMLRGGESGEAAILAGDPAGSYLIGQITSENGQAEMPKDQPPLSSDEIELIAQWIREGARDDAPASTRPQYTMDNPPRYEAPPVITALAFSPDGASLAISGYHETVIRSADGQHVTARLVGLSERIEAVAFSPDGKSLAVAGGSPGRFGELQVWDLDPPQLRFTVSTGYDTLYGASWSPDGTKIAYGCPDKSTRAIDALTGHQILFNGAHDDWVLDTVWSVKGDHLVTVSRDQSMKLINVETQRFIDNITSITPGALKGGLSAVDRHPKNDELVCGGADGIPKIYRMFREKARVIGDDFNLIRAFPAMEGRIFDAAFSADGQRIVAGSSLDGRGEVRVFQVSDGAQISSCKLPGGVFAVAFHRDGTTVAAGGFDGLVRLIRAESGEIISEFHPVELSAPAPEAVSSDAP